MITHLLIAWDRLRWLSDPLKCRLPAFVCSCATWLAGIVITLPYPIYIIYMDLGVSESSNEWVVDGLFANSGDFRDQGSLARMNLGSHGLD